LGQSARLLFFLLSANCHLGARFFKELTL